MSREDKEGAFFLSPGDSGSLVDGVRELLSSDPPGRVYAMGGCLYVYLSRRVFVIVGEGWMEVTVCTPHEEIGEAEEEDAHEQSILSSFRQGIGARLRERGWKETGARTTETTMSDSGSSTIVVTEVVSRFETTEPNAAYDEILWLESRSAPAKAAG